LELRVECLDGYAVIGIVEHAADRGVHVCGIDKSVRSDLFCGKPILQLLVLYQAHAAALSYPEALALAQQV
jgi:hypothetical protein